MMRFLRPISPRRVAVAALAITAASLPLYVVRWRMGPIPTTLLEVLILITLAAYAVTLWSERRRPAARTSYEIPIALLLLAGIAGIIVAPDHTRALGIYRAYFVETIALFYITVDLIRTPQELRRVVLIAAAGSCVFAVGQIVTFALAFVHHAVQIDAGPAFLNTSSNQVALYLEPPFAFAIGFALFSKTARERLGAVAVVALLLAALVLTLSRAAYLAIAVVAVIALLSVSERRVRLWALAGGSVALLLVLELPFISQRLGTFAHSILLRESIYRAALRMLSERPIFGAGISGFPIRVAPFRPLGEEIELYPHNLWLTTWSEIGLLGVVSFAVIFLRLLWQGIRALSSADGIYRAVTWGMMGALVLYLVHGMFDSPYWKNDLSAEFWLMAALGVVGMRGSFTQRASSKEAR
jgi:putative inorganic carbon (HCO3(-)) transporter